MSRWPQGHPFGLTLPSVECALTTKLGKMRSATAMLPLDSQHWSTLAHAYGQAIDVPSQLARLAEHPADADAVFRELDLWSSLYHQGTVYTATYAAIPHIVAAAANLPPEKRIEILVFVGMCFASSDAAPVPSELAGSLESAKHHARRLLAESLACDHDEGTTRWLLAAMAALKGHAALGDVISSLNCIVRCPHCGKGFEVMKSTLNSHHRRETKGQ